MGLQITTPAGSLPVTIEQLRKQCEIGDDVTDHDEHLLRHAKAAVKKFERHTKRALMTQSLKFSTTWSRLIALPRPPLVSVESVKITDCDDVQTEVDTENYSLITEGSPGRILFKKDYSPNQNLRDFEPIEVNYTAGNASRDNVCEDFKLWILQMSQFWFEIGRGDIETSVPEHMNDALRGMSSGVTNGFFRERI